MWGARGGHIRLEVGSFVHTRYTDETVTVRFQIPNTKVGFVEE
jgi:hypothetical protein